MHNRESIIESARSIDADVVVIGGGIAGACAAWDASLRGLKTVLVERQDFGGSTSAHSLKILHGGIRYLQHLDFYRLRESCHERTVFLRNAPHLTRPQQFLVPTYGHGMKGKFVFRVAFALLALLTADRNRGIPDKNQRIPNGYTVSRDEVLRRFPNIDRNKLTGAAVFYDGIMVDPPRLVYAVVKSAIDAGCLAVNYCAADGLIVDEGAVSGVEVTDRVSGEKFSIRARSVINAAGPYASEVFGEDVAANAWRPTLSRDMAVVLKRRPTDKAAIAIQTKYRDPDAILSRGNRHIFIVPWRNYTLVGVNSKVYDGDPNELGVSPPEVATFIDEINEARPDMAVTTDDIAVVNAGLLPFGENDPSASNLSFGKRSLLVDHGSQGGPKGLVSAVAVRWTMGRKTAKRAVDIIEKRIRGRSSSSRTHVTRLSGGNFDSLADLDAAIQSDEVLGALQDDVRGHIARTHGSNWKLVRDLIHETPSLAGLVPGTLTTHAEVVHAVRSEHAATLADVILRRTDIGTGEAPSTEAMQTCAEIMAQELDWSTDKVQREIDAVKREYPFSNDLSTKPDLRIVA